jgi:membrane protein DedA with SNARE-associated domain
MDALVELVDFFGGNIGPALVITAGIFGAVSYAYGGISASQGLLMLWQAIAFSFVGVMFFDMAWWFVGSLVHRGIVSEKRVAQLKTTQYAKVHRVFERWGAWALMGSKFVFGTRIMTLLAAGFSGYPLWKAALAVSVSNLAYVGITGYLGFILGERVFQEIESFQRFTVYVAIILGLLLVIRIMRLIIRRFRKSPSSLPE